MKLRRKARMETEWGEVCVIVDYLNVFASIEVGK
jgi:hypothetical protein